MRGGGSNWPLALSGSSTIAGTGGIPGLKEVELEIDHKPNTNFPRPSHGAAGVGAVIGITRRRPRAANDPVLARVMDERGLKEIPLFNNPTEERHRFRPLIREMGRTRDGPVTRAPIDVGDPAAMAEAIKAKARVFGADLTGIARLSPIMIDEGIELPFETIICMGVGEEFVKVLEGPDAVEREALTAYFHCAVTATKLADHIRRELGWPARAHHNGGTDIQAIPALYAAGFGELGKHGSLINPQFGASFRPSFVTTNLPVAVDQPLVVGVQDRCVNCLVCSNNCPGDAIPDEYVETQGVRRWLTDIAKCYPYSRLSDTYCHICVDVCPFNAAIDMAVYKTFMKQRRDQGYKTPKQAIRLPLTETNPGGGDDTVQRRN